MIELARNAYCFLLGYYSILIWSCRNIFYRE
uniref:Uncharacterized protein n=1 Tax=Arundo donax TaxID=35708 RepID=A0A0A8ZUX2_ARUDO